MRGAPLPWRVGRRVPEHIYDGKGRPLVTMPNARIAAVVVAAVNKHEAAAKLFVRYLEIESTYNCGDSVPSKTIDRLYADVEAWIGISTPALQPRKKRAKRVR